MIELPLTKERFICRELSADDVFHLNTFGMLGKHLMNGAGGVLDYLREIDGKGNVYSRAQMDNEDNKSKTYIVVDTKARKYDLCAYFTLKPGLIPVRIGAIEDAKKSDMGKSSKDATEMSLENNDEDDDFMTCAAVELMNFAVNANYKATPKKQIGSMTFENFIMPLVREVQLLVGAQFLYIYALPVPKLMKNYRERYQFRSLRMKDEMFVHSHIRPGYDGDCKFMFLHI